MLYKIRSILGHIATSNDAGPGLMSQQEIALFNSTLGQCDKTMSHLSTHSQVTFFYFVKHNYIGAILYLIQIFSLNQKVKVPGEVYSAHCQIFKNTVTDTMPTMLIRTF